MSCFAQDVTKVKQQEKDGFQWYHLRQGIYHEGALDKNGKELFSLDKNYKRVMYFYNELTNRGFFHVYDNSGREGVYDKNGKEYISPDRGYTAIHDINNPDGILFNVCDNQGREGVYDFKKGIEIIPTQRGYSSIIFILTDEGYKYYQIEKNGMYGACDILGNEVVEPIYESLIYHDGTFKVQDSGFGGYKSLNIKLDKYSNNFKRLETNLIDGKDYQWYRVFKGDFIGVESSDGKKLIDCIYQSVDIEGCHNYFAPDFPYFVAKKDNKIAVYDLSGRMLISTKRGYESISLETSPNNFNHNPYFEVKKNDKFGICDLSGKELIPASYYSISASKRGFIVSLTKDSESEDTHIKTDSKGYLVDRYNPTEAVDQCLLGEEYFYKGNYDNSFKWNKKAAEQGYVDAQFLLALLYENGLGTKKDLSKAKEWYSKAAAYGHETARNRLESIIEAENRQDNSNSGEQTYSYKNNNGDNSSRSKNEKYKSSVAYIDELHEYARYDRIKSDLGTIIRSEKKEFPNDHVVYTYYYDSGFEKTLSISKCPSCFGDGRCHGLHLMGLCYMCSNTYRCGRCGGTGKWITVHAKNTDQGVFYNFDGMLILNGSSNNNGVQASNHIDSTVHLSGTRSSTYSTCTYCNGSGRCSSCHGSGYLHSPSPYHDVSDYQICHSCHGSGRCFNCYGKGKI